MKIKRKLIVGLFLVATLIVAGIYACRKESSNADYVPAGKQRVMVYLNDDPIPNLYKVLIDIRYVEVKVDTGRVDHDDNYYDDDRDGDNDHHDRDHFGKWDTLSVTPRIYDLLKLKNGMDTLIANSLANSGRITKIRITLGPNNTIWTDSTHSYPLTLCDNRPYIYVRVTSNTIQTLPNGHIIIRIEFDASRSIDVDNGHYCLRPRLKSYCDNNTGKIEGVVKPRAAHARIMAYNSTDTSYAIPEDDGEFEIRGLKPATYSVKYKATLPYRDTTINNAVVQAHHDTELPLITLHQ
jgi:hypothetical protein